MRVTVRGRFSGLSDRALEYLRSNLELHDVSNSEYTVEGTLTYDTRVDHFSIRYQLRVEPDNPEELAIDYGLREAEHFLGVMGFSYRSLRATATDTAAVWGER
jgi:hypothetical protein